MTTAFVFPGQGSQTIGMGKALAEAYPSARAVFDEVDDALGEKLSDIIWEGPEDQLTLTQNAQPALMAVSMAVVKALATEGVDVASTASYVAGHSLGEYSALTAAGAFDLADAARLLRLRGKAMQAAVPVGDGAMAALLGLDYDVAAEIAAEAAGDGICQAANDNASGQVVVSGTKSSVERACELAVEKGAMKAIMLPVSAPFHCSLMAPAAEAMRQALAETEVRAPSVPVVANVVAGPVSDPDEIRQRLVEQVTGTVRWRESVLWMASQGINELKEIGAGRVLSGLTRRIDRSVKSSPIGSPEDIAAYLASRS